MDINQTKVLRFDEDTFDLQAHKKAADTLKREKARIKRIRRNIMLGKTVLAVAALSVSVLLYYLVSVLFAV